MIEGTFNSFGRHGCIVKDPSWVIRYSGEAYGGFGSITGDMLDWVVMAADGVSFGDLPTYLASAHPVVTIEGGLAEVVLKTYQFFEDWEDLTAP